MAVVVETPTLVDSVERGIRALGGPCRRLTIYIRAQGQFGGSQVRVGSGLSAIGGLSGSRGDRSVEL